MQITEKKRFWLSIAGIAAIYFLLQGAWFTLLGTLREGSIYAGPLGLFSVLLSVALLHPALFIWMRFIEKKHYLAFAGHKENWFHQVMIAANVMGALFVIAELGFIFVFQEYILLEWLAGLRLWLIWLIPMIIVTFLQVSGEELVFRGFMYEKLTSLYEKKWVAYVIPSLIWAIPHQANFSEMHLKIAIVPTMFVLGLIFADWRSRSGSLIGPLTAHLLNNLMVGLIFSSSLRTSQVRIGQANMSGLPELLEVVYVMFPMLPMALIYLYIRPKISQRALV